MELSEKDKNLGKKCFLNLVAIDALTFVALTDNAMILYSLRLGIPDYIVGILASFVFIGTAFMLAGKFFMIKYGAAKTLAYSIFFKGLFPLMAAFAPIVMFKFGQINIGIALVIISVLGFQICRGAGALPGLPIIGEITTDDDRSKFCASTFFRFHSSYLLGIILFALILRYYDSVRAFQIIICCGSILCCVAAFIGNRIKETDFPRISAKASVKEALLFIVNYSKNRELILSQTIYFISVALIGPFSMLALKEIYRIEDSVALIFVVTQICGGVTISLNAGRIINKIGSRNLFISLFFLLLFGAFLWYNAPFNFSWSYCFVLFFILGIGQVGCILALNSSFLEIIPADKRVGANLVILSTSSVIGGLFGAVFGSGTLKFLEKHYLLSGLAMYKTYFSIVLFFLLICYLYILRAEEIYVLRITKSLVMATVRKNRFGEK